MALFRTRIPSGCAPAARFNCARILAAASIAAVAASLPASGHPELAMRCKLLFNFEGKRVTGIGEAWMFDEAFSQYLLTNFDADHDGAFDAAETKILGDEVASRLKAERYFTYVRVDGKDIGSLAPFAFRASAQDGFVTFTFGFRLPEPVDPRRSDLRVQIKDPAYSVSITLEDAEPVVLKGMEAGYCLPVLRESKDETYPGSIMNPREVTLRCRS